MARIVLLVGAALLIGGCTASSKADLPLGLQLPAACRVVGQPTVGEAGLKTWELRCEDAEHVLTPGEARLLFVGVMQRGGWSACGSAAGTTIYRNIENSITTLAYGSEDRQDASFGTVRLGQKQRTVECAL